MEFGARIRSVLDEFENRNAAAAVAEVTPEHLASYIAGRAKPPFELVARIAAARNVSLDWLATGTGPRERNAEIPEDYVAVPVAADVEARFGDETVPPFLFARAFLDRIGAGASLSIVHQRGNANEPAIRDGEMLLVDGSVQQIGEDGLYVFTRDGKHLARFVETFVDGRVALKARNPDYGVQTLSAQEAAALTPLGRVLWRGAAL
ncbi:MAG: helix-turn-helix domain-containing protein [Proteobacteria bacterium]|nr:helix-turn-helix domain-containing protein [Pseudomonadota bacterium]